MTENIRALKTFKHEVVEEVVSILENELALAKEGKIVAVAIVSVWDDGDVSKTASKNQNFHKLLGGL